MKSWYVRSRLMKINKTVNGDTMTLELQGWLDTQAAPEMEAVLEEAGDDISSLIIDCTGLEYISSSGIRQIVSAHKKMNGNLTLKNVSVEIQDIFNMTGLSKRIKLE